MASNVSVGGVITYFNSNVSSDDSSTSKILTISNSNNASVTLDANINIADASKRSKAVKITGNSGNNSIKGGKGADTLDGGAGNDTITGGAGKDVFVYSGGNNVITDYVAGTDKIKILNDDITNMEVDEEDVIFTFGTNGTLTVKNAIKNGKAKKITIIDKDSVTSSQAYGAESLTISNSDGSTINLVNNPYAERASASNRTKGVYIIGNDYDNVIKGGKGADTLDGGEGNDTLTGGLGSDTFVYTGGDVVITDYNPKQKDVIRLVDVSISSDGIYFSGKDVIFETDVGDLTILNGKGKEITWLNNKGKSTSKAYTDATEKVFSKDDTIKSYAANSFVRSGIVTIDASALKQAIKLIGNDNSNLIIGGKGADTLFGTSKGDNTLTGGAGSDIFIHEGGNTVITDYKVGTDTIKLQNTDIVSAAITGESDTDIVFTFRNNSTLTVLNVVKVTKTKKTPQKITVTDRKGKTTTRAYALESITLSNSDDTAFDASVSFNDTLKKIDASKRTKAIKITGNNNENIILGGSKADTIIAGTKASTLSGGAGSDLIQGSVEDDSIVGGGGADVLYGLAGDDTLYGGAGNDTLYGGAGNDVFIYNSGNGNDVIMDYEVGDTIKLGKGLTVKKSVKSGSDYVLTIGSNKLTLKGAGDKSISVANYKNEYKTYNEAAYQERAYIERDDDFWFVESNVSTDSELDSILLNDSDSGVITSNVLSASSVLTEFESKSNSFSNISYSQQEKK